ncbi:hypothetical protein KUF71_013962 [Frankliniella fusca]|uniref:Integrase catalytic domain-containing protein n=1 Tax=Frankliniella fusca TaxID=407009 RepID=A0AAE1LN19_9NEOP|nr:hypothetical protein KUF71_013962 [Frankliniella fusca]
MELMSVFAMFGPPKYLVSDNGQPFDSNDYAQFCTSFNIKIVHSPPYCPQSNGQAEKSVDLAKKGIEKIILSETTSNSQALENDLLLIQNRLSKFLFHYRDTPTTTTLKSPNEMLLSFRPRTLLSQLLPESNANLRDYHFKIGEIVKFRLNKSSEPVTAVIVSSKGDNIYIVSIHGVEKEVHHNQLSRAGGRVL